MPCFLVVLALLVPRFTIFLIWVFSDWIDKAFDHSWFWPLLGFIFMPYTALAYMGAMLNQGTLNSPWLVVLIVAIIVDLGHVWGVQWRKIGRK